MSLKFLPYNILDFYNSFLKVFYQDQSMSLSLKNLEQIAALQFHVRLDSGSVSKIPMFFSLVDYGGRQATSKINLLDVEGQTFDNQWRKAHIPLSAFRAASRGVNLENIKELQEPGIYVAIMNQPGRFGWDVRGVSNSAELHQQLQLQIFFDQLFY